MKKIMAVAILSLVWLGMNANNPQNLTIPQCDWAAYELNENLTICEKICNNLVTGFWEKKGGNEKIIIQFHDSGRMDWVSSSKAKGTTYAYGQWEVKTSKEAPILIWTNEDNTINNSFELERTCEGLLLINKKTGATFILKHQLKKNIAAIKTAKSGLTGNWSNATYPFDISENRKSVGTRKAMKGAFLKITFQEDGTFFQKIGNDKEGLATVGRWEISKDGQFIFMHSGNKINIAKIQHLDLDELVLEWQLDCKENNDFSTQQKSFAFIR